MDTEVDRLLDFERQLCGRKVLVTGHTGFTGGWACKWLRAVGVRVTGFALPPDTSPSLFMALDLAQSIPTVFGDVRDLARLRQTVEDLEPDLILHLAAQPLVRRSYREPVETFATNVMGTVHVLEAARGVKVVRGVLCITTDKVYRNNEWPWPYRESDPLGGKDPYSASKSAAEMALQSYAVSYPWREKKGPVIASARGGNIIGGGDWSEDRLIPDFVRAVMSGQKLTLRYPEATRPWQHVLALVQGYLMLLAGLVSDEPEHFARAWNLGPQEYRQYSVRDVLELMAADWKRPALEYLGSPLPEAGALALDSSLARRDLRWEPVWDTREVVARTATWYREYYSDPSMASALTEGQIRAWRSALLAREGRN